MKKTKNIDHLFQEKFKDFEPNLDEKIWKNIESSLQEKKKKRRIVPFWWQLTGVAALVAIGVFIGNQNIENSNSKIQIPNGSNKRNNNVELHQPNAINEVVSKSNNENTAVDASEKVKNNQQISNQNPSATTETKNLVTKTKTQKVLNTSNSEQKKKENPSIFISQTKENAIVSNNNKNQQNISEKIEIILNEKNNSVASNTKEKANQISEKNTSDTINTTDKNIKTTNETIVKSTNKDFVTSEKTITSESIASVTDAKKEVLKTNELETVLAEKEKDLKKKSISETDRWQVSSFVAPLLFGSTSSGSPIDSKFSTNPKTYQKSIVYGIGASYNLTKKLALRTAINKLTLDYATNDVAFLENTQTVASLVAVAENTLQFVPESGISGADTFTLATTALNSGTLRQEFGYIEVPLELSYAVVDRKIKVNLITGLSTLYLDQNKIELTSQKYNVSLGEANNISKINFSTNFGLGFNYNVYKSLYFNLDSILKYQINTFNKNSGNFNPYTVGLYSGVSYKF